MYGLWTVIIVVFAFGYAMGTIIGPDDPNMLVPALPFDRPEAGIQDTTGMPRANITRARRTARRIWGDVCDGRVTIRLRPLPGRQSGEARYQYDPRNPLDTRAYGSCVVIVNSATRFTPAFFCAVVVHEWGHLKGRGHSRNRDSVMYPKLNRRNVPNACR